MIAALNDSYTIFSPGEMMPSGDVAALATQRLRRRLPDRRAACRRRSWCSACVFNLGLGVLSRLMPQMQVYFVGVPLSILVGFLILLLVLARDDGDLPRLLRSACCTT